MSRAKVRCLALSGVGKAEELDTVRGKQQIRKWILEPPGSVIHECLGGDQKSQYQRKLLRSKMTTNDDQQHAY